MTTSLLGTGKPGSEPAQATLRPGARPPLEILQGDCRELLRSLPDESVQMCVTSPPYWGLRSYLPKDHPLKGSEIGQEPTPEEFIANLVSVFREVRRVLRDDGTCWINIGDTYARDGLHGADKNEAARKGSLRCPKGYKPKDLVGIPWMLAFALRADGWYLRQDIIWSKPNCMPESVQDRCTRSHEYIFMFTKQPRYYYDAEAIREPSALSTVIRRANGGRKTNGAMKAVGKQRGHSRRHAGFNGRWDQMTKEDQQALGANKRSVWRVSPAAYAEAHFATFPPELIKPCILAGSRTGDTVLDPFGGSGTTGQVALEFGRSAILCELNPDYIPLIEQRTTVTPGML